MFHRFLFPFQERSRRVRMAEMVQRMKLTANNRVLDLGGTPSIWQYADVPLDVTLLNLPGLSLKAPEHTIHTFTFVDGDATKVEAFGDKTFDFVFSNSVIEHVGGPEKQLSFATEVQRLADKYWIQTPSIFFPIEAHTGMPFWFLMPEGMRQSFIRNWKRKLPAWTEMVEGTTVISKDKMQEFFPDADLITEYKFGIPKSYILLRA